MRPATIEEVELIVSEQIAERIAELERRIAPEALTPGNVAERLKLSESQVRALIRRGDIRSYTIGSSRRVDPSDLAEFINERRQRARAVVRTRPTRAAPVSGRTWLEDLQREAYGEKK